MMNVDYKIAWRYFFSKSNQTVINRISNLAVFVILIATCSLLIVLSAFSGLKDFGLSFSNIFDPDFRILPNKGAIKAKVALSTVCESNVTSVFQLINEYRHRKYIILYRLTNII